MAIIVVFVFKSVLQSVFVLKPLPHSLLRVPEEQCDMIEQILICTGYLLMTSLIKIQHFVSLEWNCLSDRLA